MTQFSVGFIIAISVLTARAQNDCGDYSQCRATCSDPDYSVDKCCGDCTYSQCKFEGCVYFGPFHPIWFPDKCTRCACVNGRPSCTNEKDNCPNRDCFGYPVRMGDCCMECDFGIPEDRCGSVPIEKRTEYLYVNGERCEQEIITFGCDKSAAKRNGQWYACLSTPNDEEVDGPEPTCCADVKPKHVNSCEMIPGSELADFGPPAKKYCVPV